ncbi:MAG: tripartite tricarboxylate transporter substrate binding protein [Clostridia bacterium]|nr:tripartite tricarboxylate transporter substrate binding protein [Clostridia bacterium]
MKRFAAAAIAVLIALTAAACAAVEGGYGAYGYPSDVITLIVPYGAGGTTDVVGRQLAAALSEELGVSVVVENKAGASGAIGCRAALDAKPDGATLLFAADSLGTQRVMGISDISYSDFTPIMAVANDPKVIVVAPDAPYQTARELLDAIAARPKTVQMAYTGPGGSGHVQALILNEYGYEPALTAYSSGSDGIVAVMSGQVQFTNSNYSTVASYIANGDLRLLAVCATQRLAQHPDVPALSELLPESEELLSIPYTPLSLLAPKGVPDAAITALREACAAAVKSPAFEAFMLDNSIDRLYARYTTLDETLAFYAQWESTVSWLLYDSGAATYSPSVFGIARP